MFAKVITPVVLPLILLISQNVWSASYLENPLAMTASAALIRPKNEAAKEARIQILANRQDIPLMEDYAEAGFTYLLQKKPTAPLVFVIPGTGGSFRSSTSGYIGEKLFQQGYSVITVDNPFHWRFVVAASPSAFPGFPPQDAKDLYRVLSKIRRYLKDEKELRPSSFSLVGYSFGGLQSLFLKKLDDEQKIFNFAKILIINPPVDLLYGVQALDSLFVRGDALSAGQKSQNMAKLLDVGSKVLTSAERNNAKVNLGATFKQLGYSNDDFAHLIATNFRQSLRDVIFASQQIHDIGILKAKATRFKRNARYEEAGHISFSTYMTRFVLPYFQPQNGDIFSLEDLNRESSLYQFADVIRHSEGLFLVHAQDDFLLKAGDVQWLKENFGPRAVIFPYGGHCGGIAFPQFGDVLKQVF